MLESGYNRRHLEEVCHSNKWDPDSSSLCLCFCTYFYSWSSKNQMNAGSIWRKMEAYTYFDEKSIPEGSWLKKQLLIPPQHNFLKSINYISFWNSGWYFYWKLTGNLSNNILDVRIFSLLIGMLYSQVLVKVLMSNIMLRMVTNL